MRPRSCLCRSRPSTACRFSHARCTRSSVFSRGRHESPIGSGVGRVGAERLRPAPPGAWDPGGRPGGGRGHGDPIGRIAGGFRGRSSAKRPGRADRGSGRGAGGRPRSADRGLPAHDRYRQLPARDSAHGHGARLRQPRRVPDRSAGARRPGAHDLAGARADRALPEPNSMRRALARQEGQILVMSALVMSFLFVPLSIFVIDTALVESGYAQLGETLQASAEDGASTIDEAAYRSSNGRVVALDPVQARIVADVSMRAAAMRGLSSWSVESRGQRVTITGHLAVQLLVLGAATLTESRSASLVYGQ